VWSKLELLDFSALVTVRLPQIPCKTFVKYKQPTLKLLIKKVNNNPFLFILQAGIPKAMIGILAALPATKLYHRLEKQGRILYGSDGNNTQDGITPSETDAKRMLEKQEFGSWIIMSTIDAKENLEILRNTASETG
jgi:hypothetical protein